MFSLTAKVCDEPISERINAGTDLPVWVRLKNPNGESCVTEELDEKSTLLGIDTINDWEQGSSKTWGKRWLGNCTNFIPVEGMKCKFDVRRDGALTRDPLRMCKLTVSFGSRNLPRKRTHWEWRGPKTIFNSDFEPTKEEMAKNWFKMQRI